MKLISAAAAIAICALTVSACAGATSASPHHQVATTSGTPTHTTPAPTAPTPPHCPVIAGGRCSRPTPIDNDLVGTLHLTRRDVRLLSGDFRCGGRLLATETAHQVVLSYVASSVGAGHLACAAVPVSVELARPLGHRTVLDRLTGRSVPVDAVPERLTGSWIGPVFRAGSSRVSDR